MKKLNKFIPLLTICATIGCFSPITLSSCASNNEQLEELVGMEAPNFEQFAVGETVEDGDAIDAYKMFMEANPDCFIQDMKWGVYQNWLSAYDNSNYGYDAGDRDWHEVYNSQLNSLKCYVSKPTFGDVWINTGKRLENYWTLSYKMKLEADVRVSTIFGPTRDIRRNHNIKVSAEMEYHNMLFFAYAATRNDKTHGLDYIPPEEMAVDTTKPGWFITISEDTDVQYKYRRNYSDWKIDYSYNFSDEITEENSAQGTSQVYYDTAHSTSTIDNYKELESLIDLKTFSYAEPEFDPETGDMIAGPNNAWMSWFNQKSESILANCILLDCVTHYLDACQSQCYMYVPEHLTADRFTTEQTDGYKLEGAWYYPTSNFQYVDKDNIEITLEIFNQGNEFQNRVSFEEKDHAWTKTPQLIFCSGSSSIIPDREYGIINPDWDTWKINKGAATTPILAQIDLTGTEHHLERTLKFIVGNYQFYFNVHPKGATGSEGHYEGELALLPIQFNDGNGTIYLYGQE